MTVLVKNLQGEQLNSKSVALTMKHFPGGGPQEGGGDSHYDFGKNQVYPAKNFDYPVRPFKAAIDAGVSSIMPYYGVPIGQLRVHGIDALAGPARMNWICWRFLIWQRPDLSPFHLLSRIFRVL